MLHNNTSELEAIGDESPTGIEVGAVLDGLYRLVEELPRVSGRPCFLAETLPGGDEQVELVVTNTEAGRVRYLVRTCAAGSRRCSSPPCQPPTCARSAERALSAFQQRVTLTGVSIRCNDRLVFHGWDRLRQRPVRVVVEPLD